MEGQAWPGQPHPLSLDQLSGRVASLVCGTLNSSRFVKTQTARHHRLHLEASNILRLQPFALHLCWQGEFQEMAERYDQDGSMWHYEGNPVLQVYVLAFGIKFTEFDFYTYPTWACLIVQTRDHWTKIWVFSWCVSFAHSHYSLTENFQTSKLKTYWWVFCVLHFHIKQPIILEWENESQVWDKKGSFPQHGGPFPGYTRHCCLLQGSPERQQTLWLVASCRGLWDSEMSMVMGIPIHQQDEGNKGEFAMREINQEK